MTYGCVGHVQHAHHFDGAAVSHSAELVRGNFISDEGPLIRSFGPPSPQGEKGIRRVGLITGTTGLTFPAVDL
jgi:hypothetical protein